MSLLSPALEAFLAVARHKTVHAAADDLHLTQTGVTQRIRTLESQLSMTLFLRSRRGMLLTSEGEALLRYCQAARDPENGVELLKAGAAQLAVLPRGQVAREMDSKLLKAERHFLSNTESLADMIRDGLGYGLLTLEFAEKYFGRGELALLNEGKTFENELALAWYPRPETSGYWKALVAGVG